MSTLTTKPGDFHTKDEEDVDLELRQLERQSELKILKLLQLLTILENAKTLAGVANDGERIK